MKNYGIPFSLFLTVSLMLSSPLIYSHTRDELNNYQETELTAEDFSLKGLDGETSRGWQRSPRDLLMHSLRPRLVGVAATAQPSFAVYGATDFQRCPSGK